MTTRTARFKQSDVTRALRGAAAAGVQVRIEIDPRGTMHLVPIGNAPALPEGIDKAIEGFTW